MSFLTSWSYCSCKYLIEHEARFSIQMNTLRSLTFVYYFQVVLQTVLIAFPSSVMNSKEEELEMNLRMRANGGGGSGDGVQQMPTLPPQPLTYMAYSSSEDIGSEYPNRIDPINQALYASDFFSNYNPRTGPRGICDLCGYVEE